ncbi:hypothetical protein AVEN_64599-1, partial [Araneus ventricosus]
IRIIIPHSNGGHGDLMVRSRLWGWRIQALNPIPLKIRCVLGLLHIKSYVGDHNSSLGAEAWRRGMPAQVSSSSSDRGSKLRGPSQNGSRVASKWDVTN